MNALNFQVKKRSGELQLYSDDKVIHSLFRAQENIGKEDLDQAKTIGIKVIAELKKRFEQEKILGSDEIGDVVERILIDDKLYDIARAFIIARERQRQEHKAEHGLGVVDDIGLPYASIVVLKNKYLRKDDNGKPLETPKGCFRRVARALALAETDKKNRAIWEERFFTVMSQLRFLPGGRTLANAGTINNQLANCFVIPMPDSVEGIFESVKESSILKKNGGGVGFSFSRIRPKGDVVATTTGRAAGPVALMKIVNEASEMLQQAGGRRSGNMVIMHVTHPDILEFITCKEDEGVLNHINFSLGVTDKFMKAVKRDKNWDLVNPRNGQVVNTVAARSIFELAASYAWKNGDPGMIFLDRINRDNPTPHAGVLEAVNLCGEQPLLSYEACNLGSINLAAHVRDNDLDWKKITETVQIGTRLLDNVVTVCKYPLKQVDKVVKSNRKIGLGVMGWADVLIKLGIPYNSKQALALAEKTMKFINDVAREQSVKLAETKGSFPNFDGSLWQKRGYKKFRNATLTTIAPTGSISMVANCSYGIEPLFAVAFYKEVMGGIRLPEINNDLLNVLKQSGADLSNGLVDQIAAQGTVRGIKEIPEAVKKLLVTAHELEPEEHIKMQAAFQKYTDNAVSKTINMRSDFRVDDVAKALILAWELGCKGITVYRDTSRSVQVLNVGYNGSSSKPKTLNSKQSQNIKLKTQNKCPQCGTVMFKAEGCATCPSCAFSVCSL
ncbi:ribonucleoside-diphosphate reductase, adenosylcobalamin-dependent [Candidatus Beckwithbacteria bacterium CG1_02_47_37]|uniref:Vitamin B12-dependent ribonucleotide reductase n=1 Tax=Candidatus Beckwithbacteria bacterium CG1_02_47_37 TaxID=1805034 RepID=A0A1J4RPZ8_9BACT|nr:MAG: ribonucleoside-diphosphate reductase, adenosylcobalamin-dependent [Candidatus Beckwithbacteria bacterium CG1_02_47_37]